MNYKQLYLVGLFLVILGLIPFFAGGHSDPSALVAIFSANVAFTAARVFKSYESRVKELEDQLKLTQLDKTVNDINSH